jgi:hypothetical protein
LQKDESIIDRHGQEASSQKSSEEEVARDNESPSTLFINFQNNCVE